MLVKVKAWFSILAILLVQGMSEMANKEANNNDSKFSIIMC